VRKLRLSRSAARTLSTPDLALMVVRVCAPRITPCIPSTLSAGPLSASRCHRPVPDQPLGHLPPAVADLGGRAAAGAAGPQRAQHVDDRGVGEHSGPPCRWAPSRIGSCGVTARSSSRRTRQISSTRYPTTRCTSMNSQINGGEGRADGCGWRTGTPDRTPPSTWACAIYLRSVSAPTPSFGPNAWAAAPGDEYSFKLSMTIRTAASRCSLGYLFDLPASSTRKEAASTEDGSETPSSRYPSGSFPSW